MRQDMRLNASRIIRDGYAYIQMPKSLLKAFDAVSSNFDKITLKQKENFSFPKETEGFLSFGNEYATTPERPDLCDRFCYWPKNRQSHIGNDMTNTNFYKGFIAYEAAINPLAQDLFDAICFNLGGAYQPFVKDSSYLQFCVYHPDYQIDDREYLQDPHEDGHLLTFIKPTSSGLFLHTKMGIIPASPSTDQLVVLAGSLLEILTDGEVCAMHHSVKNPPTPTLRKSLMYFMNPNLSSPKTTSLIENKTIDLVSQANHHHARFGNNSLSSMLDT